MTKEQLLKRAKLIKGNKDFCARVSLALAEIAQEKRDTGDQSDITPEESIYAKFVYKFGIDTFFRSDIRLITCISFFLGYLC